MFERRKPQGFGMFRLVSVIGFAGFALWMFAEGSEISGDTYDVPD